MQRALRCSRWATTSRMGPIAAAASCPPSSCTLRRSSVDICDEATNRLACASGDLLLDAALDMAAEPELAVLGIDSVSFVPPPMAVPACIAAPAANVVSFCVCWPGSAVR
jgi:hypothetical protein